MAKTTTLVALILGLVSCTYNIYETTYVEEDGMRNMKGILGPQNKANLGKSVIVAPGASPVGKFLFTKDSELLPGVSAEEQFNTENISIVVSATQLDPPINFAATNLDNVSLQVVITWEQSQALFGFAQDKVAGTGINIFQPEVVFDLQLGSVLTIPAIQSTRLKVRYTARTNKGGGFDAFTFPRYRVNAAISYGDITPESLTFTQVADHSGITPATPWTLGAGAPGGSETLMKTPFASTMQVTWNNYRVAGPLDVEFFGQNLTNIWGAIRLVAGTNPPPVLPWPNEAIGVTLTNQDAANAMQFVRVVNQLSL